jgi:hypothetical protein
MAATNQYLLSFGSGRIPHEDMPEYLNRFDRCEIRNASSAVLTLSILEAAACGLEIKGHEEINRDYVIRNHSIPTVTQKLLKIYEGVLNG